MQRYILKRRVSPEYLPGWAVESSSPFEVGEAVTSSTILYQKTAQALSAFFSHAGLTGWELENLHYSEDFPEFELGDVVFFVYCPYPGTFQFWKGTKID